MKRTSTPFRRLDRGIVATAMALAASLPSLSAQTPAASPASPSVSSEAPAEEVVELSPFVVNSAKDVGYMANSTLSGSRTNTDIKDIANPLDIFTAELMQDLAVQDIQDLTVLANGVEPNAAGDYNSDGQEREVWNYNYMQIRGFKTGTATRNFMELNGQFEAYNSERVEFSKGPNSILFGSGNPGGSTNYSTKAPRLQRNAYSFQHRTDDLGSQRVNVDLNHVVLENQLAVRLNALWEDQEFYRHPAYEKQFAWHLTGQWQPNHNTTITLGYEKRDSDRASPRGIFARDRVKDWLDAGSPIVTAVPSNNNVVIQGSTGTRTAASLGMATLNSANWILDSDGVIRNAQRTARGDVINVNTSNMDTAATGLDFPLDVWVGGANGINDSKWGITELNVTQRITDDLFLDFAAGRSDNDIRQGNSVSRELYVDTNNFGVNTHPGEMYAETRPFWIDRGISVEDVRLTASYNLDLTGFNRWLGRHQIAAMYEYNKRDEWWDNGRLTLTQTPSGPVALGSTGYQNNALAFNLRDYLNPATGKFAMYDMRDIYYSDGIEQDGYVARYVRRESYAAINTRTKQDSMLAVLQSRWLDDRLVTTLGVRKDRRDFLNAPFVLDSTGVWVPETLVAGAPAGSTHPQYAAFTAPATFVEGISRNYGAVVHATKWLSFTFNYGSNFSPRTESRGIFGEYLPASTGESKDYGVRLSLFDNRLNVSLLKFETSELGSATNGNSINSPFNDLVEIEDILVDNGIITSSPLVGVWTSADRTGEGEELTIIGNPTPSWTFRFTASRLVNEQRNLAPEVRAYYQEMLPFYESQNPNLTGAGSTTTLATRINEAKTAYALMDTRENVQVFPSSEFTARFTGKYSFGRESRFRGLSIGASSRWSSAPIIGYYRISNPVSFDVSRSKKGSEDFITDLFFTYERRFDNVNWRVQLNISNVFDQDDPWAVASVNNVDAPDYTWVAYRYRPRDGRVISLTNSFSF